MPDYRLLKSQKNEVLLLIQEARLNPGEFDFEEREEEEQDDNYGSYQPVYFNELSHRASGYTFAFRGDSVSYSPGSERPSGYESTPRWLQKRGAFAEWLTYLKREVEAPDLWASLVQEQEILRLEPSEADNTPFTPDEQVQIKRAIDEIRIYITSTYSLEAEPLTKINQKLDYLVDASTRLGRIDWKNLFVGALISLALQQLSPSGPALRELVAAAGHLLRHVLTGVMSPPLLH